MFFFFFWVKNLRVNMSIVHWACAQEFWGIHSVLLNEVTSSRAFISISIVSNEVLS